jgi:hypothetical protein
MRSLRDRRKVFFASRWWVIVGLDFMPGMGWRQICLGLQQVDA